jgi:diadenosine tetraphosphate (Ap4A) HIT family hydrolase
MNFYRDEVLSGNAKVNIVLETANTLAFHHTRPCYPVHIVVIPKENIDSLVTLEEHGVIKVMTDLSDSRTRKCGFVYTSLERV